MVSDRTFPLFGKGGKAAFPPFTAAGEEGTPRSLLSRSPEKFFTRLRSFSGDPKSLADDLKCFSAGCKTFPAGREVFPVIGNVLHAAEKFFR